MFNLLTSGMTADEITQFKTDHESGRSDVKMQVLTHMFSALTLKHDTDVISDAADAAMYRNEIRSMSVVRSTTRETTGYCLLQNSRFVEGSCKGVKYLHIEPQVFIAALFHSESGAFDLHYNFVNLSEFANYFRA